MRCGSRPISSAVSRSAVRSSFEFLSMSTLDLFASILGTFVLITFVLLPYYLRQPSLERDIAQAEAETSALDADLRLYRDKLSATQAARSEAYLRTNIVYRLGEDEIQGLREFYRRASLLGLIPRQPELRFHAHS